MERSDMGLVQTIAPTAEPLSLAEAKQHLRLEGYADEDTAVAGHIAAATADVETFTTRQIVTATWALTLDYFPYEIELPHPPLQSVSSITYVDMDGDTQTVDSDDYTVIKTGLVGRVVEAYEASWPSTRDVPDAVTVTYVAGYATPFTAASATDILTWSGATPVDDDIHVLSTSGGEDSALPAGLAARTRYWVRDTTGVTCKLAASDGGAVVDVTDTGTSGNTHFIGTIPANIRQAMKLLIGHWYENREAVITGTIVMPMKLGVERLLWRSRVVGA